MQPEPPTQQSGSYEGPSPRVETAKPHYDAFVSYAREDSAIALRLQRRLEALAIPAPHARPRLKVFVDVDELSASPSLTGSIRAALEASRFLVIVASRHSARSRWVHEEIRMWLDLGRRTRVLFLVADGDPDELLRAMLDRESDANIDLPLAADIRGPSMRAALHLLDDEYLRIAAPLLGLAFDDLRQRATRIRIRRQRQVILALSSVLVVVASTASVAVWQWHVAVAQRHAAEQRLSESIGVANSVLTDVDQGLKGVAGAEDLRLSLVTDATEMLDRLAVGGSERTDLAATQIQGHLRRGRLAADYRDYDEAERELNAAENLLARFDTDSERLRAETLVSGARGELALSRKAYVEAVRYLDRALQWCASWAAEAPGLDSEAERANLLRLRGDAKAFQRRWEEASGDYEAAKQIYGTLQGREPRVLLGAARVQERLSRVAEVRGDADAVIARLSRAVDLAEAVDQQNSSPEQLIQLVELYGRLSELGSRWEREDLAASFDRKALDMVFALYVTNPQNARYRRALGDAWERLGEYEKKHGNFARAKTLFALHLYMSAMLAKQAPTDAALWAAQVEARANLIEVLLETDERAQAREQFAELTRAVNVLSGLAKDRDSQERSSLLIMAYNLQGEAARQLDLPDARARSYQAALELSEDRFRRAPENVDARLDLLVAHANVILAAAGKNDGKRMRAHAESAKQLLEDDLPLDRDERAMIEKIRELIRDVLREP